MKRKLIVIACTLVSICCIRPSTSVAIEGQVTTGGKVSFRANQSDDTSTTSESTANSSTIESGKGTSDSTKQTTFVEKQNAIKPQGRLPNTGNVFWDYKLAVGVILGCIFFLLFLRKHRKWGQS